MADPIDRRTGRPGRTAAPSPPRSRALPLVYLFLAAPGDLLRRAVPVDPARVRRPARRRPPPDPGLDRPELVRPVPDRPDVQPVRPEQPDHGRRLDDPGDLHQRAGRLRAVAVRLPRPAGADVRDPHDPDHPGLGDDRSALSHRPVAQADRHLPGHDRRPGGAAAAAGDLAHEGLLRHRPGRARGGGLGRRRVPAGERHADRPAAGRARRRAPSRCSRSSSRGATS